jgi:hypothetical protein
MKVKDSMHKGGRSGANQRTNQRRRGPSWLRQSRFDYSKETRPLASSDDAVIES